MLDDRSGSVLAVAIVFACSTWISIALRLYVRVEQIARFGWDDITVIGSQLFFTAYLVCQIAGVVYGTGRHLADLSYKNAEIALRYWFFCEVWYSVACSLVKISICLSLRRVCVRRLHTWCMDGLILWSICLGLAFLLGVIFQCIPAHDWWDLDPDHKHCLDSHIITSLTYTVSALNIACDWSLAIFPFFIVKDLTIPMAQKIMVASILAFGALGSTATVVRIFYIQSLEDTYLGWNGDFLYNTAPVAIWTTVEVGVGITAICLSTLRPLISKLVWLVRPYTYGQSYDSSYAPRGYAVSLHSTDSRVPIPLDSHHGTSFEDDDEYAGVTQFNATRAIGSRHDRSVRACRHLKPMVDANATRINATKPLSSSDLADEYDNHSQHSRSYGIG